MWVVVSSTRIRPKPCNQILHHSTEGVVPPAQPAPRFPPGITPPTGALPPITLKNSKAGAVEEFKVQETVYVPLCHVYTSVCFRPLNLEPSDNKPVAGGREGVSPVEHADLSARRMYQPVSSERRHSGAPMSKRR